MIEINVSFSKFYQSLLFVYLIQMNVSFSKLPVAFVYIFQLSVHVTLNVLVTNHHACHHKQFKQVSVLRACRI